MRAAWGAARMSIQMIAGRSERPCGVQRHHRAAGGVGGQADDLVGADVGVGYRLADGGAQGLPPFLRALLGPAGLGKAGGDGGDAFGDHSARQIEDAGPHALGPGIDAYHVDFCHDASSRCCGGIAGEMGQGGACSR